MIDIDSTETLSSLVKDCNSVVVEYRDHDDVEFTEKLTPQVLIVMVQGQMQDLVKGGSFGKSVHIAHTQYFWPCLLSLNHVRSCQSLQCAVLGWAKELAMVTPPTITIVLSVCSELLHAV